MRLELLKKTDQAIRALRYLEAIGGRRRTDEIAETVGIAPPYVPQVMGPLVRHGWVDSARGPNGGYEIVADLSGLSMRSVIEAIEGPVNDGTCVLRQSVCNPSAACALHEPWIRARAALLDELDNTRISGDRIQEVSP